MSTNTFVRPNSLVQLKGKNFFETAEESPCVGCSAPCCRLLIIPHATPNTYMDLDYIRYMVGFQSVKMILNRDGSWQVLIDQTCQLLDQSTSLCTAHGTPRQPKTCVYFNPYRCWYKRNFTTENPPDVIRLDMKAMEIILAHVRFNEEGLITEVPSWETIRNLVARTESQQKNTPWHPTPNDEFELHAEGMAQ